MLDDSSRELDCQHSPYCLECLKKNGPLHLLLLFFQFQRSHFGRMRRKGDLSLFEGHFVWSAIGRGPTCLSSTNETSRMGSSRPPFALSTLSYVILLVAFQWSRTFGNTITRRKRLLVPFSSLFAIFYLDLTRT